MNAPQILNPAAELPDVLARILADKQAEVRSRSEAVPLTEIERQALHAGPPRPFIEALCETVAEGRVGLIAEIKRASPSRGLIRDPFEPKALAEAYERGEATCLSVLTDMPYFQGRPEDLKTARAACRLPVLRKDFIIDPWQVFESRAMGADCVLLILAALSDEQAETLEDITHSLDMAVLLEVHDQRELDRALGMNSRLIGVNNRNLRTLVTDLGTAEALMPQVPADKIPIAESGIRTPEDVRRMAAAGSRCILVGEHLMRQADVAAAASALVHAL